jgi:transposase
VLACAQGGSNLAVAARLGVNRGTVTRWRARFLAGRLDGLSDEPVRPFPGWAGALSLRLSR